MFVCQCLLLLIVLMSSIPSGLNFQSRASFASEEIRRTIQFLTHLPVDIIVFLFVEGVEYFKERQVSHVSRSLLITHVNVKMLVLEITNESD